MVWRRKKRRQDSASSISVDWSHQAAYISPDDPTLKPKLDILAEQKQAIRNILYLYWDLATSWGFISGQTEFAGFDRWRWLQREADYDGGVWCSHDDALLLRQGSAVGLLCELEYDWDVTGGVDERVWKAALDAGRFDRVPEARRAVEAGLKGEEEMGEELSVVYDECVMAFFAMLAREGRPVPIDPSTFDPVAFLSGMDAEQRPRSSFRDPR